jgi:hypothetical protein
LLFHIFQKDITKRNWDSVVIFYAILIVPINIMLYRQYMSEYCNYSILSAYLEENKIRNQLAGNHNNDNEKSDFEPKPALS